MSRRRSVLDAMCDSLRRMRGGRYHVIRGAANWAAHDFSRHRFNVAVMQDRADIFADSNGMRTASLALEFAAGGGSGQIDDRIQDEFLEDAERVLRALKAGVKADGSEDPLVFQITSPDGVEFHDAARQVQGLMVEFEAQY